MTAAFTDQRTVFDKKKNRWNKMLIKMMILKKNLVTEIVGIETILIRTVSKMASTIFPKFLNVISYNINT